MAETLKSAYGRHVPETIAGMVSAAFPAFERKRFLARATEGYEALELMARGRQIARALAETLPPDFEAAAGILVASLGPKLERTEGHGLAPFLYLPHTLFVADRGLAHFDAAMAAQYELTQRFTAEFSIRSFIERYPERVLERFEGWAEDASVHVRRLVSEGTRPRLPWAPRLRVFAADPEPVLALLERLADDPEPYVRRSVANHLNDIGKDDTDLLLRVADDWLRRQPGRRRLIAHALRSAVKQGHPAALALLGYGHAAEIEIRNVEIAPARVSRGERVAIGFEVANATAAAQRLLLDLRVFFVTSRGVGPRVFKLKTVELAPAEAIRLEKRISLADMTTRKHHAGVHRVEALVNGRPIPLGAFDLS